MLFSDDAVMPVPPVDVLQQDDEMLSSVVTEEADHAASSKSDEPSVQCLAADLLSTWLSLKVSVCLVSYIAMLFLSGPQGRREPQQGLRKTFSRGLSCEKILEFCFLKMVNSDVLYISE